jgi:predicted RNA polymerase sigma factor
VFEYVFLYTRGERALSEDVVQDAFCAAAVRWAKIRDLPDEQRLIRLKAIARNKAVDAYRRRATARARQGELKSAPETGDRGTHRAAMMRMADFQLWSAVREMPPRRHRPQEPC